jgi:hypothetical protein
MRPLSLIVQQGQVCPTVNSNPKHIFHMMVMLGLLLKAYGVTVSSLAKCANIIELWNPAILGLLDNLPYDKEVVVWGRRWIVKTFSLGEKHGYGVYACEDIIVEDSAISHKEGPIIFPYDRPIYKKRHWKRLLTQHHE